MIDSNQSQMYRFKIKKEIKRFYCCCSLFSSSSADTAFDAIIGCIEDIIMGRPRQEATLFLMLYFIL